MTVYNEDIASALNKHLELLTPSLPIAWENTKYTPTAGQPYLISWHLPGETDTITLGPNGVNGYSGLLQVDCMFPLQKGSRSAKVKAGLVCTHFKRGTLITFNAVTVRMLKAFPHPAQIDGDYYKVSVSAVYESYEVT
jgi:hypothetical protein